MGNRPTYEELEQKVKALENGQSERRPVEVELADIEKRGRVWLDHSPVCMKIVDLNYNLRYMSDAGVQGLGVDDVSDLYGKPYPFDFYPKSFKEEMIGSLDRAKTTGGKVEQEAPVTSLLGEEIWFHSSIVPVKDDGGEIEYFLVVSSDTTERKQAEESLRESRARYSDATRIANLGHWIYDQVADRLEYCSDELARIHGLTPDDYMAMVTSIAKDIERVHRDDQEKYGKALRDARRDATPFDIEYRIIQPDGEVRHVREMGEPICDRTGKLIQSRGTLQDITELKQAEEDRNKALVDAEQANQAKSEFLATMSHELRTPLNAILGFSDILTHQYFGPPGAGKYREYAEDIHASGEHLLELVNDLLDISSIEAGKQSILKEMLSTEEIVRECVTIITEKARSNGIELATKVSKNLPPLYADKRAIKQILLNLLSNSVKFTAGGGKIMVSVKASNRETTLEVADTGRGIPAEKLPKLTDPFTRGEQDPHRTIEGWGLGLSIANSLVDLHEGAMDIESKIGKGTTVTVTLPNGASASPNHFAHQMSA